MSRRKIAGVGFKSLLSGLYETMGNLKFISISLNLFTSVKNNLSTISNIYTISFIPVT